jgi:hypothetical protein
MDGCNTSRQQYDRQYRRIWTRIYRQTNCHCDRPTYGNKRPWLDGAEHGKLGPVGESAPALGLNDGDVDDDGRTGLSSWQAISLMDWH